MGPTQSDMFRESAPSIPGDYDFILPDYSSVQIFSDLTPHTKSPRFPDDNPLTSRLPYHRLRRSGRIAGGARWLHFCTGYYYDLLSGTGGGFSPRLLSGECHCPSYLVKIFAPGPCQKFLQNRSGCCPSLGSRCFARLPATCTSPHGVDCCTH